MLETTQSPTKTLQKKRVVKKYTLSAMQKNKPVSKQIADLQWRLKFAQMKLNHWHGIENGQWVHLDNLQKSAKKELRALVQ